MQDKGIRPCIPGRKSRRTAVRYDRRRYKRRNQIEITFGRLKDWRRIAPHYDRCTKTFLSAIPQMTVIGRGIETALTPALADGASC